jgi:hypothetical protein
MHIFRYLIVGDMMIQVVLVPHVYIQGYMYMRVLRILFTAFIVCYIYHVGWAMKSSAGTLTMNA